MIIQSEQYDENLYTRHCTYKLGALKAVGFTGLLIASFCGATEPPTTGQQIAHTEKAKQILKPYTAEYKASVEGLPFSGTGSRSLEKNADGTWTLSFSADTTFVGLNETSQFLPKGDHLITNQYTYKRTGLGNKPTEYASFNWQQNKIHWQQGDKQWAINLKPETLDKLSYQLQLRMDLAASNQPKLSYDVADDDEVYKRQFIIEGEETIKTGVGKLNTIKIKIKRDDDDRSTWIWFAKDYDYFLVKLL
ncbi:MAG: DUF3108 domain-containing protein, partial [Endozoicomonas sp.]